MEISAKIDGIKYEPKLCRKLNTYNYNQLGHALSVDASFLLKIDENNKIALSWWVSPKRTRSYPYARVYDTLNFQGKKVTIIPVFKDEGKDGDRDFLQWDTISLMSLLGIYTIVAYYKYAEKSSRYANKITNQQFDICYIKDQIKNLLSYQSDALHWNICQIEQVNKIAQFALEYYKKISENLKVEMHSESSAEQRIQELNKGIENFKNLSRSLAEQAQNRELMTIQPKENLSGNKATITIKNYLGGFYYFTCDEAIIENDTVYLIEGKHSQKKFPSGEDIKDGLVKMILFKNLKEVTINGKLYKHKPVLKLTCNIENLESKLDLLKKLEEETKTNCFKTIIIRKNKLICSFPGILNNPLSLIIL